MKKLFILFMLFPFILFSQQLNHTWGYTTAGVAYTQTGAPLTDGSTTLSIVFDLQDFHIFDWNPLVSDTSGAVIGSSNKTVLGTFWYKIDAYNAGDSTVYAIKTYPGFTVYHPNDGSRITAANLSFDATGTTLIDTTSTLAVDDVDWRFLNVYIESSTDAGSNVVKHLPPEFLKTEFTWSTGTSDSLGMFWDFVYWANDEQKQTERGTTRSDAAARKQQETLH